MVPTVLSYCLASLDRVPHHEKLEVKMLSGLSERGTGAVFGAQGCGKRATYIRQEVAGMTLNSEITEDN